MTSPKHLWSGNWRAEAEAEAQRRREREAQAEAAPATPARAPEPDPYDAADATPAPARRTTGRGVLALLAVVAVLAGAGGAGLTRLLDGNGNGDVARPAALPVATDRGAVPKGAQTRAGAVYAAASPAVVSIRAGQGSGTGFLTSSDGTIVTNEHVVENSGQAVQVRFGTDGRVLRGEVLAVDASSDLAAIRIDAGDIPNGTKPLEFADSDQVRVGDEAIAIGNPFGLDRTATEGIVSSVGRSIQAPNHFQIDGVIQTDAAINPGNSGGPLLNAAGHVIGVNSQIATSGASQGNVGIGFAVPSNTVRQILPGLMQGKAIQHAWLGVETDASAVASGATIGNVITGGPADSGGLQAGDVVTKIDGQAIRDPTALSAAINRKAPGDKITLEVVRDGTREHVAVTLRNRPAQVP